jgi:hypothetical protein
MANRYAMPLMTPSTKPAGPMNFVPSFESSHCPASPGNTMTKATATIRDTHSIASANGERFSGGMVTGHLTCIKGA